MDTFDPMLPPASTRDALITTSLDGRVLGWSRGAQALFGWREREILGRQIATLLHEKHRAIDAQTLAEASGGRCVRDAVVKWVRRDGAVLDSLQTLVPMRDATGRVTAVVRIVFDLTSLREAERALRRMFAQVGELADEGEEAHVEARSELARSVHEERERTRRQYLRVIESEARQLARTISDGLVTAATAR